MLFVRLQCFNVYKFFKIIIHMQKVLCKCLLFKDGQDVNEDFL
jgi:hypothetical protein